MEFIVIVITDFNLAHGIYKYIYIINELFTNQIITLSHYETGTEQRRSSHFDSAAPHVGAPFCFGTWRQEIVIHVKEY